MHTISVVGLGPGHLDEMPLKVYRKIKESNKLYVRTADHPAVGELEAEGIEIISFDSVYEALDEQFEDVYTQIVSELGQNVRETDILYGVPGHPMVAEKTVQLLLESDLKVDIIGGKSFIDDLFQAVEADPVEGFQLIDGLDFSIDTLATNQHLVIMQVFNSLVAGNVKLSLMAIYPDEHQVALVSAAGSAEEMIEWVPLYEIDRFEGVNNLLSIYVPPLADKEDMRTFAKALEVTDRLFSDENGDIWANTQTNDSLIPYLEEEAEELKEAVKADDIDEIINELGDILLQILFHTAIGEKSGYFTIEDVIESYNKKMYHRVPHVFSNDSAHSIEEAENNWQRRKNEEGDL